MAEPRKRSWAPFISPERINKEDSYELICWAVEWGVVVCLQCKAELGTVKVHTEQLLHVFSMGLSLQIEALLKIPSLPGNTPEGIRRRIMNLPGVRLPLWNRPAHFMRMSTSSKSRSSHLGPG
jgi:hypothetical protein